jgi:phosphopantothenoylcysteine decarboxylase/phosphopantothenate--cysteine ligase
MERKRRSSSRGGGLSGKRILLIVTGGIAAYKAAVLVRLLRCGGAEVRVVMSEAATEFVTPLTFAVLSENPVSLDMFTRRAQPAAEHVELAKWAERIVVAPATADIIAKAAVGIADCLASTVLVASRCPVMFAPSMNEAMWASPTVRRNVERLAADGKSILGPGSGALACGDIGPGRMMEPEDIMKAVERSFAPGDLAGVRILVTAGRTEEMIDPVRYLSNRSSGRMGFALARKARERGAAVTLIHGVVDVVPPQVDALIGVRTAAEMKRAVDRAFPRCDVVVMAAAVADFTPVKREREKIKRTGEKTVSLELRPTSDILGGLKGKKKSGQVVIGFALETRDAEAAALRKIREKGCDYLVLNTVGERTGFASATNRITLFRGTKKIVTTPVITKDEAASVILDAIASDGRLRRAKR